MKRYKPDEWIAANVTMSDLEAFYTTHLIRTSGSVVMLTAPLLVCMALHGQTSSITYLLKKFPLVESGGWTRALEQEAKTRKQSFFCWIPRTGDAVCHTTAPFGVMTALAFSNRRVKEFASFQKKMPRELRHSISDDDVSQFDDDVQKKLKMIKRGGKHERRE
jgi:hypothetical protein